MAVTARGDQLAIDNAGPGRESDDGRGDIGEPAGEIGAVPAEDGSAGPGFVELNPIAVELELELPIFAGRRRGFEHWLGGSNEQDA